MLLSSHNYNNTTFVSVDWRLLTRLLFLFYFVYYPASSPNLFLYGHSFTHFGDHIRWFSRVMNYSLNPHQFTGESKFRNHKNKTLHGSVETGQLTTAEGNIIIVYYLRCYAAYISKYLLFFSNRITSRCEVFSLEGVLKFSKMFLSNYYSLL